MFKSCMDQMGLWSFFLYLVLISTVTATAERNITVRHSDRRGKALKISKKPCTDPSGRKGICTFKWDCINNNGTLMGTCVDGFIFGTCCQYDYDPLLMDSASDFYPENNQIFDDQKYALAISRTTTTTTSTTSTTTTTTRAPSTTPAPKWPIHIFSLPTMKPSVKTTPSSPVTNSTTGQLITWTSIGPTRPPQRPIILQPFPFRPGANFPTLSGGWPVGVAFPVDHFQMNRPLQVYRPPVMLQAAQNNVASQAAASSGANSSFTILNGPDRTTQKTTSSTKRTEMTTVSVPIPQWSTETVTQSSLRPGDRTTARPLTTAANFSTASQHSSASTGKPLKNPPLDYRKDCGVRGMSPKGRIVGGQSAHFGRWPWQVLVKEAAWLGLYQKNKCGGVLVSSKYAITAGHCQPGRFLSALVVILGEYNLLSDVERPRPEMRRVKRMIVHRHYNPSNFDNDIAVLELDPPVVYRPHISPICLPDPGEDFTGRMAYVTGWGKTTHGGAIPNLLQEVQVPIMSNKECISMFKEAGHTKLIKDTFLCAGYKTGGKDSCEGDSGGPLMVERANGQWVLAGTVSHGIRCADPNLPGVYMKISAYRSWIDKIIK